MRNKVATILVMPALVCVLCGCASTPQLMGAGRPQAVTGAAGSEPGDFEQMKRSLSSQKTLGSQVLAGLAVERVIGRAPDTGRW